MKLRRYSTDPCLPVERMANPKIDYAHIAEKLAIAIEQAMWSAADAFDQQAQELCAIEDALKQASDELWTDTEARKDRATILALLETDVGDAEDPRAKEFGTLFVRMMRMSNDDRARLAEAMVGLLRFAERKDALPEDEGDE
jgi:hypothetical protein